MNRPPSHPEVGEPSEPTRVWILDDSPLHLEVVRRLLAAHHTVRGFTTGEALLEGLSIDSAPDLIVLDWQLPGISGLEVAGFIRGRFNESTLPLLMLSSKSDREDLEEGLRAGANDYVTKPFNELELVARVRTLARLGQQSRALREREDRLRLIVEASAMGAWSMDLASREVTGDGRFRELLGFSASHGLDWPALLEGIHADDRERVAKAMGDAIAARNAGRYSVEYRQLGRAHGATRWLEASGKTVAGVGGHPASLLGTVVDITARKTAELELERQMAFEQLLVGIVSHDLRNPLNVISLSVAMLDRLAEPNPIVKIATQRIQKAAERATHLVNDLLDFTEARIRGGIQIQLHDADLDEIARVVLEEVEAAYPDRLVETGWGGNCRGKWDAHRLSQVVQNLVTNAMKYSPVGSVVTVMTVGVAREITLTVHNHGAPIPPTLLASLFEPLRRGSVVGPREEGSIGLGLFIVKEVIDAHGGTIAVTSSVGSGTTFTVRLPRGGPPAHPARHRPGDAHAN